MTVWIEPQVKLRWWNPLTWVLRLLFRRWYVMSSEPGAFFNPWCHAVCKDKHEAREIAIELMEKR